MAILKNCTERLLKPEPVNQQMLLEVLHTILDGISANKSFKQVERNLLKEKKFSKTLVSAAWSWIYDRLLINQLRQKDNAAPTRGLRVLTEDEKHAVGTANYNRIMTLLNKGIISASDVEVMLTQLLAYSHDRLTERELNMLLISTLLDSELEQFAGTRFAFPLSDKIN